MFLRLQYSTTSAHASPPPRAPPTAHQQPPVPACTCVGEREATHTNIATVLCVWMHDCNRSPSPSWLGWWLVGGQCGRWLMRSRILAESNTRSNYFSTALWLVATTTSTSSSGEWLRMRMRECTVCFSSRKYFLRSELIEVGFLDQSNCFLDT